MFDQIKSLTDQKITEMLSYKSYTFKKENRSGIYLLSVDKKTIQAESLEKAQEMAGKEWEFIYAN